MRVVTLFAVSVGAVVGLPTMAPSASRELRDESGQHTGAPRRATTDWIAQLTAQAAAARAAKQATRNAPVRDDTPRASSEPHSASLTSLLNHFSTSTARSVPSHSDGPPHDFMSSVSELLASASSRSSTHTSAPGTTDANSGDALASFTSDPLVMSVIAATMMSPRGFQVMSNPQLLLDPAVRDPIVRHVLSARSVQHQIMDKLVEFSPVIAAVIGQPKNMNEDQSHDFLLAIQSAVRRSLEPRSINLLVNDHEYFRSIEAFIDTVAEEARTKGIDPMAVDEWKRSEAANVNALSQLADVAVVPMIMQAASLGSQERQEPTATVSDSAELTMTGLSP